MADKKYESLRNIVKDANLLAAKRAELDRLITEDKREWALNRAFYRGNQWAFWNPVSTQVETLPVAENGRARNRVRITDNQIMSGVNYWVAQLVKTKPVIGATPDSGSDRDIKSAQMAESLFEDKWEDLGMKSKLQSALNNAALSQGYWKISWDPLAGKSMKFMLDPHSGQPISDEQVADIFRDQLQQQAQQAGMDPQEVLQQYEKTIQVGEIRIDVMPGENVWLDLAANNFEDINYAICKHAMDPDEVKARFGVDVTANSAPTEPDIPVMFTRRSEQRPKTTRDVYVIYVKKCPAVPQGAYVAWIEEPNQILYQSAWPYPFDDIPLVKFPGYERPNSPLDEPITTQVRPLQKELNRSISQIIQHKDLTLKPQMIAPVNSLRERITDEPGAVFQFNPVGGMEPKWRDMPGLPQYVFAHLDRIQQRIDEKYNKLPSKRDSMPARVDAGYSIELLQEAVADQLSPITNRIEVALAKAGKLIALYAQAYYTEPRLIKIRGAGGSVQAKRFVNSDIAGGFSFHAEAETGLPKSRAGRQQRIMELVDKGILRPDQAIKHLDIADLKGLAAQFQADEDQALREHDKLIQGAPLNTLSMQQAIQAVQQGMNPDTGQPMVNPEQEAMQIIQKAAFTPLPYENPDAHLEVHSDYMKSAEFDSLPDDARQRFVDHYEATLEMSVKLRKAQMAFDPKNQPKVAVAARSTMSAPVLGEILRQNGIDVTDEQVAEEPLETAVYDSIDKPDMDEAANDPFSQMEQMQAMEQQAADHASKMAQANQRTAMAEQRHQTTMDIQQAELMDQAAQADAAQQQQQEAHQQKMAHQQAVHEERLRQMRKPKPTTSKGG